MIDGGCDGGVGPALGIGGRDPADGTRVDHHTGTDERILHLVGEEAVCTFWLDHRDDVEVVAASERKIALVVGRDRHDGSRPVRGEHVVGDPNGDLFAIHRVGRIPTCEDTGLLLVVFETLELGLRGGLRAIRIDVVTPVARRQRVDEVVLACPAGW